MRYTPITNFVLVDAVLLRRPDLAVDALRHLVLPALALCTVPMAIIARMTRSSMLEVLRRTTCARPGPRACGSAP